MTREGSPASRRRRSLVARTVGRSSCTSSSEQLPSAASELSKLFAVSRAVWVPATRQVEAPTRPNAQRRVPLLVSGLTTPL